MKYLACFLVLLFMLSCDDYSPKPRGYFRIDFPENAYSPSEKNECSYRFDISDEAEIKPRVTDKGRCWIDIVYPRYKGQIYCSYKDIKDDFQEVSEDTRNFVYKHAIKADAITEQVFENPEKEVYGILYELKGNTASPIQFILTDSTSFLFRGALYFNATPNKDSIAPVVDFVRKDIVRLMESFEHGK